MNMYQARGLIDGLNLKVLLLGVALLSACGGGADGGEANPVSSAPSWEAVALPVNLIESVAVSRLDRRIVYAGQRNSRVNAEHAIWRSDDGGESFKVVAIGVSFRLFPSTTNPDMLIGTTSEPDRYAGFGNTHALYFSRNRGQDWQPAFKDGKGILLNDSDPGRSLGLHPSLRDTIYAYGRPRDSVDEAVYKSTDGGASWVDVSPQGVTLKDYSAHFAFDPLHPETVYLSTNFSNADGSAGVLLRTVDGGKSWQAADAGLLLRSNEGSQAHLLVELVATTVPGVIFGVSNFGQLWINSDGGAGPWRAMPLPLGTVDRFLWSARLPNTLVLLNRDGTMQRSDDLGSNWKPVPTPGKISASILDDSDSLGILITTAGDETLYRSVDAGQTWSLQVKPAFSVSIAGVSVTTPDHLIAYQAPRLEVLVNGQWQMPRGMESFRSTVAVSSLAAFGNRLATVGGGALFQQNSQGAWNWAPKADGQSFGGGRVTSDGDRRGFYAEIFVGFRGTYTSRSLETTDAGAHWTDSSSHFSSFGGEAVFDALSGRFWYLATPNTSTWAVNRVESDGSVKGASAGLPAGRLNALANSPQAPSVLYIGTQQGIYRSTDAGASWSPAYSGSSGAPVSAIAVDPKDSMTVWALAAAGLMRSNDGGAHWVAVAPENFASGAVTLALHPSRSGVVVVSASSGIWISVDAGAKWLNLEGPKAGVKQVLLVADAINVATDTGLFRCESLCQAR